MAKKNTNSNLDPVNPLEPIISKASFVSHVAKEICLHQIKNNKPVNPLEAVKRAEELYEIIGEESLQKKYNPKKEVNNVDGSIE